MKCMPIKDTPKARENKCVYKLQKKKKLAKQTKEEKLDSREETYMNWLVQWEWTLINSLFTIFSPQAGAISTLEGHLIL